jgi:glycosyltransferase involved in cell wall biosynthesis
LSRITYFDFTNIIYSAIYVNGFMENADEYGYEFAVSHKVPPEIADVDPPSWLAKMNPYTLFRYEGEEQEPFFFCTYSGDMNGSEEADDGYYEPFLKRFKYFFKVNYNSDVIAQSEKLNRYAAKIKPVPVGFPIALEKPWRLRPQIGRPGWSRLAIKNRIRRLTRTVSLDKYRRLRQIDEDLDLFFLIRLYAMPGYEEENERRRNLIDLINKKMDRFNILVKYSQIDKQPDADWGTNEIAVMPHRDVLNNYARSRVGLYIRGLHGCLSFKFGELMALGKPIAGESLLNNRENMYKYDHFGEQFAYDDPEELVDRIIYLLKHPDYREELKQANIETFENSFTPKPVTQYILDQMSIQRLR